MSKTPQHIAIIMDGNGRWAQQRHLPKVLGHRNGAKTAERIIEHCYKIGIKYLTLYGFSSENWQRPQSEIAALMELIREYLNEHVSRLINDGARLLFIGDRHLLDPDIVESMAQAEAASAHNKFCLILAISYGARNEIREAAISMAHAIRQQSLDINALPPDYFDQFLQTNALSIPDPDLLIRTGGEQRISNFLLWQAAYAEFYFSAKYWPDFTAKDIDQAITEYGNRERRYGK